MGRKAHSIRDNLVDWNIDRHLNPYIPHNALHRLPKPISRFLGHRDEPQKEAPTILQWPITFLATVAGLCLVSGISNYASGIQAYHPPVVIASLGASAILDFNAIASPLAQPRNSILGNTIAALCGVCVAKLFQLNMAFFQGHEWLSGAVGCALSSLMMSVTGTLHPPGGATAVLASTEPHVIAMGWDYIWLVLLFSTLEVAVALIFNNIFRRYPMYWWVPGNVGQKLKEERRKEAEEHEKEDEKRGDVEKAEGKTSSSDDSASDRTLRRELSNRVHFVDGLEDLHIRPYMIELPHHVRLSDDEIMLLETIQERLRKHGEIGG